MSDKVVFYTKKDCIQCKMTRSLLDERGIYYQEINLDNNPEYIDYIKDELGFMAAPVVKTDTDAWSGFRPGKIKAIKQQ